MTVLQRIKEVPFACADLGVSATIDEIRDAGWRIVSLDIGEDSESDNHVGFPVTIVVRKLFCRASKFHIEGGPFGPPFPLFQDLFIMDVLQLPRAALRSEALDAVIVPTADPYLSEYVAPCWALRAHLSGFEGSAGVLCVAADFAALSVDSRYWVQAEKTLVDGVELLRAERDPLKEATSRLLKSLSSGARVAIDPRLVSHEAFDGVSSVLAAAGIELLGCDVFEKHPEIWPERPSPVVSAVRPMKRPGVDARVKLAVLRQTLESDATDAVLLTSLDEIAWLTNLRGRDVPCNPVFGAVMLVRSDRAELFSESVRFDETARSALAASGIELREPEALGAALQALEGSTLLLDPRRTSHAYVRSTEHVCVRHGASPVAAMKSHKSPAELELIREAMLKDASPE